MRKVLFSGFFDLIHCGHLRSFEMAKSFGDHLTVHLGSDQEIRAVKGEPRPIIEGKERAELVEWLKPVDEVIYTEGYLSFTELLDIVKPDVVVRNLGGYSEAEEQECQKRGVMMLKLPHFNFTLSSTSSIIKKIGGVKQPKIAGVNFAIVCGEQILLQKRGKGNWRCPNTWAIPGGTIEEGENPLECCKREILEETGLDIPMADIKFLTDHTYTWGETTRFFIIKLSTLPFVKQGEGEMHWVLSDKIPKLADNQNDLITVIENHDTR